MKRLIMLTMVMVPAATMATLFDFNTAGTGVWGGVVQTVDGITATATGVGGNITVMNWNGSPVVAGGQSPNWLATRVDFSFGMSSVSAFFGDNGADDDGNVVLTAYDALNNMVDQQSFAYGTQSGWASLTVVGGNIAYVIGSTTSTSNPNSVVWDNFSAQPVPEPATIAALGLGAAALMRRRNRR